VFDALVYVFRVTGLFHRDPTVARATRDTLEDPLGAAEPPAGG